MGYESNLYIAEAPRRKEDGVPWQVYDGKAFCALIASFDLCKVGYNNPVAKLIGDSIAAEKARIEVEEWRYSVYETADGNTQHATDKYDDPVSPIPLTELIETMAKQDAREPYRRYAPVLAMLHAFADQVDAGQWGPEGIVVLHYGH